MKLNFDLHLHSCLSPCGGEDNTPANLAAMCALAGLDAVALTDHNAVGNCAAFCEAAGDNGLVALPGMELTTLEEVHVVCLLPDLDAAAAFGDEVYARLPPFPNDVHIFGPQVLMDAGDRVLGEEPRMLAGAANIGVYEVKALVERYGGVCWPAHIDRPSFSLLSNLGLWDPGLGFGFAEVSRACPADFLNRDDLRGLHTVTASDAHYLDQIMDPCQSVDLPSRSAAALLAWLRCPDFRLYSRF
ncbi:PHP domain-containing protein [Pseudoflavonifractor sp. BIOML-A6]|nr:MULTISPECIES: PHP domain-containing protein [unclassified Pseudoflavonifractor]MTQ97003.1 PHP domain-containing protein [Pseudoflavonifractor sp. BIOML-A16]MTR06175.1 PHP domain-containing protein [Pseudoflavonifractor sp. BIOML-A15]MTR32759.1 PHP domain-containing protein [Pseudoflavonifractor sp. BIOML-A14]MTR72867.1 PHP domain-containing protein [Pseudoflavonifractor sp. BIOML-A18]MTS63232.1 PHP domain-containing protein [Pseudoflavonifractor sp. BIOML-A5]MTS70959.1 PHP domain-containin